MANKIKYLVTYDICTDKRRVRLHNKLKGFGVAVQYSVFECLLDAKEKAKMLQAIQKIIHTRQDAVRVYTVCAACDEKTTIMPKLGKHTEHGMVV